MAISKTLTPTNVTIQIPDFTDRPDQRANSNCIDKEADAINALNAQIATLFKWVSCSGKIGALSAGAYGYVEVQYIVPAGYKTTGIATIGLGHPGASGGLSLVFGVSQGIGAGTRTGYISYYTPRAVTDTNSDYTGFIECVKSDYSF